MGAGEKKELWSFEQRDDVHAEWIETYLANLDARLVPVGTREAICGTRDRYDALLKQRDHLKQTTAGLVLLSNMDRAWKMKVSREAKKAQGMHTFTVELDAIASEHIKKIAASRGMRARQILEEMVLSQLNAMTKGESHVPFLKKDARANNASKTPPTLDAVIEAQDPILDKADPPKGGKPDRRPVRSVSGGAKAQRLLMAATSALDTSYQKSFASTDICLMMPLHTRP